MKRSIAIAHFVERKRRAAEPVAFFGSRTAHRDWSGFKKSEALSTAQASRSAESEASCEDVTSREPGALIIDQVFR
jgi:hypothetical protein